MCFPHSKFIAMKNVIFFFLGLSLVSADDKAADEFVKGNNLFAPCTYKQVSKSETGNFLVSPFSAEAVIAFAQSGAKGETGKELRNATHLPDDQSKIESGVKTLIPKLQSDGLYSLHTANKLYVKEGSSIKDEFKNAATQVYHAGVEPIDFTKKVQAAGTINSWVENQTNDKIKNLISSDDLNQYTRAVLINALYLKANWSKPFLLTNTEKRDFHKTPTEKTSVDFLHHYGEHFKYFECPHVKAQILELPFVDPEISLVVVLPLDKNGLSDLENKIETVFSAQHELKTEYLNVALPKFKIETSIDFKKVLQNLGVHKVFDEGQADLSGIAGNKGDLFISKIQQKTFIDVNEEGVEAAAATLVLVAESYSGIIGGPVPKNFVADHPFIFYIKVKDLIIFAGRVTDPSKS